jgi:hypothetical protein
MGKLTTLTSINNKCNNNNMLRGLHMDKMAEDRLDLLHKYSVVDKFHF